MALNLAYQNKGTIIHRRDPRVKLLWLIAVSLVLTSWNDPLFLLGLFCVVLLYARIAGFRVSQSVKSILPGLPFIVMILLVNVILWRPPSLEKAHLIGYILPPHGRLPTLPFYWETLAFSLGTMLRIFVLMISVVTMIRTVSPAELALAITRMGVPPEIGMTLSMAISYIPAMINQLLIMMQTQQSRAWRMNTSNPVARFLAYIPITIPTFFRSFQTAEAMAASMLSRGFGYDMAHRTELKSTRYSRLDWIWTGSMLLFLVCCMTIGILGLAQYTFTLRLFGLD